MFPEHPCESPSKLQMQKQFAMLFKDFADKFLCGSSPCQLAVLGSRNIRSSTGLERDKQGEFRHLVGLMKEHSLKEEVRCHCGIACNLVDVEPVCMGTLVRYTCTFTRRVLISRITSARTFCIAHRKQQTRSHAF